MSLRVLLLQLPLGEPDTLSTSANIPLAAGYLAAYGSQEIGDRVEIRILPREIADHAGDAGIIRAVEEASPDMVGFTLYLWNRERSLSIASELKRRRPDIITLAGGPETAEGPRYPGIDAVVSGEGETSFVRLLRDFLDTGKVLPLYVAETPAELSRLPNPYLTGDLPLRKGDPVYLETLRGCRGRCSYCYYGKAFEGIQRFPDSVVEGVFAAARVAGVSEIYIMDPELTAEADFEKRIARMAELNPGRIPLHTELRLESITPEGARLLREAGFVSVEAGLQSIHGPVLRPVRRSFNRKDFLRGADLLRNAGIEIRTGIILGLPGDTPEGFGETLDFVLEAGLAPGLEIYPLAVLPGTELRSQAASLGVEYMPLPPYWVLETPALPPEDILRALALAEEKLGIEYFRPIPPRFTSPPGYTGTADLGIPGMLEELNTRPEKIAADLTLLIPGRMFFDERGLRELISLGEALLSGCPYTVFKIVIGEDAGPLTGAAVKAACRCAEAFFNPRHPLNRWRTFHNDPSGMFSVRLYYMTGRVRQANYVLATRTAGPCPGMDLVFYLTPGTLKTDGPAVWKLLENRPFLRVRGCSWDPKDISRILELYKDHPGLMSMESSCRIAP
jgi:hypothetical protein